MGDGLELLNGSISREIIYDDVYRMLGNPIGHFDTIIDIGANAGVFCIQARVLNPKARILAFEPYQVPRSYLEQNMKQFKVEIYPVALGDGGVKYLRERRNTTMAIVKDQPDKDLIPVVSLSPEQIFALAEPKPGKIMLKVDCEGSERYFIGHEELLRRCEQVSLEIHYEDRVPSYKTRSWWQDWIKQFADRFTMREHWSSKYAIVVLKRKQ